MNNKLIRFLFLGIIASAVVNAIGLQAQTAEKDLSRIIFSEVNTDNFGVPDATIKFSHAVKSKPDSP